MVRFAWLWLGLAGIGCWAAAGTGARIWDLSKTKNDPPGADVLHFPPGGIQILVLLGIGLLAISLGLAAFKLIRGWRSAGTQI